MGGCIFERIRKQVEEHLLVFVRIDPDEVVRRTDVHGQFDLLFFESVLEHLDNRFDEVRHPIGLDVEFQHVGFEFLEVKQLVHQAQHAARVAADDVMGMPFAFGQTMVVDEAKGARDERQRGAELMRHVGEEAHVGITHALDDRLFAQRLLDAASVAQVVGGQQRSVGNGKRGE